MACFFLFVFENNPAGVALVIRTISPISLPHHQPNHLGNEIPIQLLYLKGYHFVYRAPLDKIIEGDLSRCFLASLSQDKTP